MKKIKSVEGETAIHILEENEITFEIFTNYINKSIETTCFPDSLKEVNITPNLKKMIRLINLITGLLAFYL